MKKLLFIIIVSLATCAITMAQPSSFSLANSHVTMPKGYNDFTLKNSGVVGSSNFGQYIDLGGGNWFKGSTSNGRPSHGTLHLSNGAEHKGSFDRNLNPTGIVLSTWPDGTWYYGHYENGVRHGSGSWYVNGSYYDVEMSNNEIERAEEVEVPRYNKASFDGTVNAANNAYSNPSSGSYSNGSSSRSASARSKRTCPKCKGSKYVSRYVPSVSEYGIKVQYYTCNICGQRVLKNSGHGHTTCNECHGTGYVSY